MTTEEVVDNGGWKRSGAVDYAMRLLTLQIFSHLQALLGSSGFYTVDDARILDWNEVKWLQSYRFDSSSRACFILAQGRSVTTCRAICSIAFDGDKAEG